MTEHERDASLSPDSLQVYCLQCLTAHEPVLSRRIGSLFPDLTALCVEQEKHRSVNGHKSIIRSAMLPGYVFLYAHGPVPFRRILSMHGIFRFLSYGDFEDYALRGDDLAFARWVWRHKGLFACSQAARVGSAVKIISGPLTDCLGTIERLDRHNRNACLRIPFDGTDRIVWMPFEWVQDAVPSPVQRPEPGGED